ncbi:MAG: AAA family ATPase [Nitrosopumilus sp.]|nr:AAA family ATPase [Nitrosopumilus sp.]MDH5417536.1 AAA family ATPase [Nitrosopumilus sp.]MDH5555040.1 AAA family ATPase [Nitrosopumilus sp.]
MENRSNIKYCSNQQKYTLKELEYLDWNNSIQIMNKAYEAGLFVIIIGPKGTGKTSLVRDFAKKKNMNLESINFSLRTRESHLIGTKTLTNGTVSFEEGILIKSMRVGDILYLDEINSAEADVLLRLDEALDDRRQIALKESTGEVVKAKENWFVVATINPLTHSGTKELPPQLLSRFPVRIKLEYPPEDIELEIVKKYVSREHESEIIQAIKLANTLRQAAAVEELFYSPSLRETIAFGKLLDKGMSSKDAAGIVFGNVYTQWGNIEYQKVSDIITSMFGN